MVASDGGVPVVPATLYRVGRNPLIGSPSLSRFRSLSLSLSRSHSLSSPTPAPSPLSRSPSHNIATLIIVFVYSAKRIHPITLIYELNKNIPWTTRMKEQWE
jgi:hypothetical protein